MPLPLGHAHSAIIKLSCGIEDQKKSARKDKAL
jgi:hypothetical protein